MPFSINKPSLRIERSAQKALLFACKKQNIHRMATGGETGIVSSGVHPNAQGDEPVNKKTRILIVDDNSSFRKGMRALLDIQPDMEVVGEAPSGHAAMELVVEICPDLVLLDAQMPGMTGVAVTRRIKRLQPQTKIILLTMYSDYRSKAIEAGADAFITKGLPPEHMLSVIRGIIRKEE
jgi:CheY-like chemotaxis protein